MAKSKFDYTLGSFCEEVEKTDGIKVIYSFKGIVIANVTTFEACNKFFNTEDIRWCIAEQKSHFASYCLRKGNSQYFIIDFNNLNSDKSKERDYAMIGFTIKEIDDTWQIYAAHSKSDINLLDSAVKSETNYHPFEIILKEKGLYNFVIKNKMKQSKCCSKVANILLRLKKVINNFFF